MKSIVIQPSSLKGSVLVSAEDEIARIAVCCAALSNGMSYLSHMPKNYDFQLFMDAVSQMGMKVMKKREVDGHVDYLIKGAVHLKGASILNAGSESNLRWLIPLAAKCEEPVRISTKQSIPNDFLIPYLAVFNEKRVVYHSERGHLPLVVDGKLPGGEYCVPDTFPPLAIAGLILALPTAERESWIEFPKSYKLFSCHDLVIDLMARFGMEILEEQYRLRIPAQQYFEPADITVEGNMKTGMVWFLADAIGSQIHVQGIKRSSLQRERNWKYILRSLGLEIQKEDRNYWVDGKQYEGIELECSNDDDALFATALFAFAEGESHVQIESISSRMKRRLEALMKLGIEIQYSDDGWIVSGKDELQGGEVDASGDPFLGMILAILSTRIKNPIIVHGFEWIHHQEPMFWGQFSQLGGKVSEEEIG